MPLGKNVGKNIAELMADNKKKGKARGANGKPRSRAQIVAIALNASRKKSYKTGGVIPKTGMYKLHAGEMVVPASMPMSPMANASMKFEEIKKKYFKR